MTPFSQDSAQPKPPASDCSPPDLEALEAERDGVLDAIGRLQDEAAGTRVEPAVRALTDALAADTTVADLRQEMEFVKAEGDRLRELVEQAEVDTERKVNAKLRGRLEAAEASRDQAIKERDEAREALELIAGWRAVWDSSESDFDFVTAFWESVVTAEDALAGVPGGGKEEGQEGGTADAVLGDKGVEA